MNNKQQNDHANFIGLISIKYDYQVSIPGLQCPEFFHYFRLMLYIKPSHNLNLAVLLLSSITKNKEFLTNITNQDLGAIKSGK